MRTHGAGTEETRAALESVEQVQRLYERYVELARLAEVPTVAEQAATMMPSVAPPAPLGFVVWNR